MTAPRLRWEDAVHALPLLAGLAVAAAGIVLIWARADSAGVGWCVLLLGVAAVAAALARGERR